MERRNLIKIDDIWRLMIIQLSAITFIATAAVSDSNDSTSNDQFSYAWSKAVTSINRGNIQQGLLLLDSLCSDESKLPDSILLHYAAIVAHCFLPFENAPATKTVPSTLLSFNPATNSEFINNDELQPTRQAWSVISSSKSLGKIPIYKFTAQFYLKDELKLKFGSLKPVVQYHLVDNNPTLKTTNFTKQLIYDPDSPLSKMDLTIIIDCQTELHSLSDYLCQFVCGKYDIVKEKKEANITNALSIRCYNHPVFHNAPGDFFAFALFDRVVFKADSPTNKLSKAKSQKPLKVRYLIAIKTNQIVENRAEHLFQAILKLVG